MSDSSGQDRRRVTRRVSAFASAKMSFNISAEIGPADVKSLRPNWNDEQCQEFLRANGDAIGQEMVTAGAMALAMMLEGVRHAN
jgi:hypothetical protein